MGANYITRGILLGGSLGALSVLFGVTGHMFFSVGVGMMAGFFAGITRAFLVKRRKQ